MAAKINATLIDAVDKTLASLDEKVTHYPEAVETSELMRQAILVMNLPVRWIPLHMGAFGVACLFDANNREQ